MGQAGETLHEDDVYAMVAGQVIAELRQERGLSQRALSRESGVSQSSLSRVERGEVLPDVLLLRKVSGVLDLESGQLGGMIDSAYERALEAASAVAGEPDADEGADSMWATVSAVMGGVALTALVGAAVTFLLGSGGNDGT